MRLTSKSKENGGTKLSMCARKEHEEQVYWTRPSRRVDDVDALAGMLPAYMLAHMTPLLAASAAVRTLESRGLAAFVA